MKIVSKNFFHYRSQEEACQVGNQKYKIAGGRIRMGYEIEEVEERVILVGVADGVMKEKTLWMN